MTNRLTNAEARFAASALRAVADRLMIKGESDTATRLLKAATALEKGGLLEISDTRH